MLVLLLGPSGVGKTSIIHVLAETCGWSVVPSYITRPQRDDERYKRTLSQQDYQNRLENNQFFTHVEQFQYMYGTLKADIELAQSSDDVWVLDFDVYAYKESFIGVEHLAFVVLPESEEQLKAQLLETGRADRLVGAIQLLSLIQNSASLEALGLGAAAKIINCSNRLGDLAATLIEAIGDALRRR